jgi:signal peptidase II
MKSGSGNRARVWLAFIIVLLVVLVSDQLTKSWVVQSIPLGGGRSVLPGYFDIVFFENRGAAFGLLSNWESSWRNIFFYGVSFFAALFLIKMIKSLRSDQWKFSILFGAIAGGAAGNIWDRVQRGAVVDFLYLHWKNDVWQTPWGSLDMAWPAFNIADAAISLSVLTLLFTYHHVSDSV